MSDFVLVSSKGHDYRVYFPPGGGVGGRVCRLQKQYGRLCERDLTADSEQRRELLARARRMASRQ